MAQRTLPKTLNSDDMAALLAQPNVDCPTGLRNRTIMQLMYHAGLRVSETTKVNLRDFDWKANRLRLRPEVTKGGREAVLPLDDQTIEWLERWKPVRRRHAGGSPLMFTTLRGGQLDRHYLWEMVARCGRKAGIEQPVFPHMLRHSYATELLHEGYNIREVQQLLRHSDIRTTVIYTHVSPEELAKKIRGRR